MSKKAHLQSQKTLSKSQKKREKKQHLNVVISKGPLRNKDLRNKLF